MAYCSGCGQELAYSKQRQCFECKKKWSENRKRVFNQAVEEIGPLNAENLKAIQKRVKQLERRTNAKFQPKSDPNKGIE